MISLELKDIAKALDAELIGSNQTILDVSTNSAKITDACLFVALVGERFDAHTFIPDAISNGAIAVLVHKKQTTEHAHVTQLVVSDTTKALGALGEYVCDQVNPFRLALTGSCGKTTVKEMLASILKLKGQVHVTQGNFNNEIGVPLTLLGLQEHDKYGVFELGANHEHEIDYTSSLVKPQIALINNIAPAHLEGFGSIDGVARAKSEIFHHLHKDGIAIINLEDRFASQILKKTEQFQQLTYSSTQKAHVYASDLHADGQGMYRFTLHVEQETQEVQLQVPGRHQVDNALAAASMALATQCTLQEIAAGLQQAQSAAGRMQLRAFQHIAVMDDSYNANPKSVSAAIDWLSECQGESWLVLGDLGEMGSEAKDWHASLGQYAAQKNIDRVFTLGDISAQTSQSFGSGQHFFDFPELWQEMQTQLKQDHQINILVKGSRSARMERVVHALSDLLDKGDTC